MVVLNDVFGSVFIGINIKIIGENQGIKLHVLYDPWSGRELFVSPGYSGQAHVMTGRPGLLTQAGPMKAIPGMMLKPSGEKQLSFYRPRT